MQKIEKALIATSNTGKIKEFQKIFSELDLVSLADLSIEDAIEDGLSFVENAIIKARHGAKHSRLYSIADDSGFQSLVLSQEYTQQDMLVKILPMPLIGINYALV